MSKKYFVILISFCCINLLNAMEDDTVALNEGFLGSANSEADIAGLAKKLVSEAEKSQETGPITEEVKKMPQDKRLKWYVDRQSNPSGQKRLNRIFRMMGQNNKPPVFVGSHENIIPEIVLRELDVLVGSGTDQQHRNHCLSRQIDNTILHIGYATLARNLAQTKKASELQKLQATIKQLNNKSSNKQLHELIQESLEGFRPYEDNFLSFWINQEELEVLDAIQKQQEFKKMPFNLNEKANMDTFVLTLQKLKDFTMPIASPIISLAINGGTCITSGGNPLAVFSSALSAFFSIKSIPESYQMLKYKTMALWLMQRRLIGLRIFVEKLKGIQSLLNQTTVDRAVIDKLILPTAAPEMAKLTQLLEQDTFKSAPSFWSHWGRICAAYRLMLKKRSEFVDAYLGLGLIDFIASLNTLLKHSTVRAPYCLATYTSELKINTTQCWSPLIDRQVVVANDVRLGGNEQKALVITGPNARGKTTIMRAIASACLLASTIGIAPTKTIIVPCNLLFLTSINVGDDPARNLSLFAAVSARIGDIITALKKRADCPHLVISDEPFVGTDRNLAEKCARELIKSIALRKNALSLFSSHFDVKGLEQELPNSIANYHVAEGYKFIKGIDSNPEQYKDVASAIIEQAFAGDGDIVKKIRKQL